MCKATLPSVSYCLCGDQAIFLDLHADRYFTLPSDANAEFLHYLSNGNDPLKSDRKILKRLTEDARPCLPVAAPVASFVEGHMTRPKAIDLILVSIGYLRSRFQLKRRGIAAVLAASANRSASAAGAVADDAYSRINAAFIALSPIFGHAENCLARSIAFHALAVSAGHRPALVIGVKTDPFAAHCWVQEDAKVLNDSVEHVRIFTPILIV